MKTYYSNAIANGVTYLATVTDFENGYCSEHISKAAPNGGAVLAEHDFETCSLKGDSMFARYAKAILISAIYKDAKTKNIQFLC